jgi:tetrahydromethanopterin S-methyltransferase subunit B
MKETEAVFYPEDDTVDLADIFWSVVARWRSILVCALVLALLLGAYKGAGGLKKLNDPDFVRAAQESSEAEQHKYTVMEESLRSRMDDITRDLLRQREYEESSALYAIDPYNVFVRENCYRVEADGESGTAAAIGAYKAVIEGVALEELLSDGDVTAEGVRYDFLQSYVYNETGANTERTVREDGLLKYGFIQIYPSAADGTIGVMTLGVDAEQADRIMAAVDRAVADAQKDISASAGPHSVTCTFSTQYRMVSQTLVDLHDDLQERTDTLNTRMDSMMTAYKGLTPPASTVPTLAGVVKSAVKFAVVGFVLGGILGVGWWAVVFLFNGAAVDPEDLTRRSRFPVLSVYAETHRANAIDRAVARHRGVPADRTREGSDALAAINIRQAASGAEKVLAAGSVGRDKIAELCGRLSPLVEPMELIPGGDVCTDALSAEALGSCDAVLFVEEIGVSRHKTIDKEVERAARAGKPVLGFILTGKARP